MKQYFNEALTETFNQLLIIVGSIIISITFVNRVGGAQGYANILFSIFLIFIGIWLRVLEKKTK